MTGDGHYRVKAYGWDATDVADAGGEGSDGRTFSSRMAKNPKRTKPRINATSGSTPGPWTARRQFGAAGIGLLIAISYPTGVWSRAATMTSLCL